MLKKGTQDLILGSVGMMDTKPERGTSKFLFGLHHISWVNLVWRTDNIQTRLHSPMSEVMMFNDTKTIIFFTKETQFMVQQDSLAVLWINFQV